MHPKFWTSVFKSYFRTCGKFRLSSIQWVPRIADEKEDITVVKPKVSYVGRPKCTYCISNENVGSQCLQILLQFVHLGIWRDLYYINLPQFPKVNARNLTIWRPFRTPLLEEFYANNSSVHRMWPTRLLLRSHIHGPACDCFLFEIVICRPTNFILSRYNLCTTENDNLLCTVSVPISSYYGYGAFLLFNIFQCFVSA